MVVRIRLARFGKRHQPLYNIVVAQARTARDSRPMEVLGTYDPTPRIPLPRADDDIPLEATLDATMTENETQTPTQRPEQRQKREQKRYKELELDTIRTKYWLGVGAQPSEPVWRLFAMMGLVDPKPGRTKDTSKAS